MEEEDLRQEGEEEGLHQEEEEEDGLPQRGVEGDLHQEEEEDLELHHHLVVPTAGAVWVTM